MRLLRTYAYGFVVFNNVAMKDLTLCGFAVGTLRMGVGDAPVSLRLKVKGVNRLWVADASVMPSVTSANTNAPSIMIGHRAAHLIADDVSVHAC